MGSIVQGRPSVQIESVVKVTVTEVKEGAIAAEVKHEA